ncbi:MAG TPA: hypothetical protein VKV73_29085 [Chloroflexota bacterium]|nr:hypothetical protein [Chloroflexota bacterium]
MPVVRALVLALGALLVLSPTVLAQIDTYTQDPAVVVDSFLLARSQRRLDALLAHFAADAVVVHPDYGTRTFSGHDEIRLFLQLDGVRTGPRLASGRRVIGNTVTWTEPDQGELFAPVDLTVEAVVEAGKIRSLMYRSGRQSAEPQRSEPAATMPVGPMLGVVVSIGALCLLAAFLTARRPMRPESRLRGRLLAGLGAGLVRSRRRGTRS